MNISMLFEDRTDNLRILYEEYIQLKDVKTDGVDEWVVTTWYETTDGDDDAQQQEQHEKKRQRY